MSGRSFFETEGLLLAPYSFVSLLVVSLAGVVAAVPLAFFRIAFINLFAIKLLESIFLGSALGLETPEIEVALLVVASLLLALEFLANTPPTSS